ncbi:DUF3343 domain-containing protein [Clostridium felsineum]|uniref:Uncharacterized protein n=1 Tax=Clostridium felsineum TaxID=36839 RepID=A0A1S8M8T6_9CLOT|nr:DUF3343 domain-containing protein [Clostridium felsineum]MCR3759840.1 DUF3343 domain-containing protein [Clostridium felsineum]URZ00122.1 hypothetical protein CLAUR_001100 [Clostridium felsineum]URZ12261.1 hypothetical protein CROST_029780 [Clostridium felsineum]URZ16931.1 hypothetical protein CLFE_029780 [Clostridium felsineum DSM 794]
MKTKDLQNEYLVVFKSQNHAVYIYGKLNDKKIKTKIIQTPCSISTSCTHSVKFTDEIKEAVINEIKSNSIAVKGLYKIERNGTKKTYRRIEF